MLVRGANSVKYAARRMIYLLLSGILIERGGVKGGVDFPPVVPAFHGNGFDAVDDPYSIDSDPCI